MQAISPRPQRAPMGRNLGYFFIPPLVGLALLVLALGLGLSAYRAQHSGRVYTGVTVQGLDLGQMTVEEAQGALAGALPYAGAATVTLVDPATDDEWPFAPAQLGIRVDASATAAAPPMNARRERYSDLGVISEEGMSIPVRFLMSMVHSVGQCAARRARATRRACVSVSSLLYVRSDFHSALYNLYSLSYAYSPCVALS